MQKEIPAFSIDGHESGQVIVRAFARSNVAQDYWDGNWIDTSIEVKAGSFSGVYGAYLRLDEISTFRDQVEELYSLEAKEAKFETMEGQLGISIVGDNLGHYTANCVAVDSAGIGNRFAFELVFDQTDIPNLLKGLNSVINQFPVVGDPNK